MSETETALASVKDSAPTKYFEWRDSCGVFHAIDMMDTGHLFHILRMIWNHSMPEEARSVSYHRYRFGSFYTEQYMKDAIKAICRELGQRTDMQLSWESELEGFMSYLISKKKLVEAA